MPRKLKWPVAKAPPSDPQRERVYRMERECTGGTVHDRLSRKRINDYARNVCRAYRMPQLKIRYKDLGVYAGMWEPPNLLTVNHKKQRSLNLRTAAHELAHHLHYQFDPEEEQQPHGPEFMACYMSILDSSRMIPVYAMRAICRRNGIKYLDPGEKSSLTHLRKQIQRRKK